MFILDNNRNGNFYEDKFNFEKGITAYRKKGVCHTRKTVHKDHQAKSVLQSRNGHQLKQQVDVQCIFSAD